MTIAAEKLFNSIIFFKKKTNNCCDAKLRKLLLVFNSQIYQETGRHSFKIDEATNFVVNYCEFNDGCFTLRELRTMERLSEIFRDARVDEIKKMANQAGRLTPEQMKQIAKEDCEIQALFMEV